MGGMAIGGARRLTRGGGSNVGSPSIPGRPLRKWMQALSVAIEQCTAAMTGGVRQVARSHSLAIEPVQKSEAEVRAVTSYAENLWHKHDAMRMMEETNKEIGEQIKEDMREFVANCSMTGASPTLAEWAKVSMWAADTGGARDSGSRSVLVHSVDLYQFMGTEKMYWWCLV